MRIPANQAEWIRFVKSNYWTISTVALALVVCWQGLTLYLRMQSWDRLERRVDSMLEEGVADKAPESIPGANESPARTVEVTFFYRPKPQYKLTAILGDYVILDGQEVRAGGRVEKATIESIDSNGITLLEDGSEAPRKILLFPELEERKETGFTESTGRSGRPRNLRLAD